MASLTLPVVETFHSLQGEGLHAGRSAFFLRLGGCNVGCPWCDTRHSWELEAHPRRPLDGLALELVEAAAAGAAFAVVTGGEPLEHDLGPLCEALAPAGLPLHLETSGAAPLVLSGRFAWITLSPKRHRPPSAALLAACDELKVVVHEPADLAFAEAMAAQAIAARAALVAGSERDPAGTNEPQAPLVGSALGSGEITAQLDPAPAAASCLNRAADHSSEATAQAVAPCPPVASRDRANERLTEVAGGGLEPGVSLAQTTRLGPALLLQPGWNCRRGQELALEFVRRHPAWRLSLQSHKWLGVR